MKCSRHEAESLSNLVASLGVDHKGESVLNDGLWLSMEEKGWKQTRSSRRCKPLLLTGFPSSGAFVELQRQQNELQKVSRDEARKQIADKRKSMRACIDAYRHQVKGDISCKSVLEAQRISGQVNIPTCTKTRWLRMDQCVCGRLTGLAQYLATESSYRDLVRRALIEALYNRGLVHSFLRVMKSRFSI